MQYSYDYEYNEYQNYLKLQEELKGYKEEAMLRKKAA